KGKEQYTQIGQLKEKVLDVAKRQINQNTDISFDYGLYKRGRSYEYSQIYVSISKDKPKQLEIDYNKHVNDQKNIRTIMSYGISEEKDQLIIKDGFDEFIKIVEKVNERARKGEINVENAAAYIIGTYQKKGVLPKA